MLILRVSEATTLLMSLTAVAMLADGRRVDMAYKTSISDINSLEIFFLLLRQHSLTESYLSFSVTLLSGAQG